MFRLFVLFSLLAGVILVNAALPLSVEANEPVYVQRFVNDSVVAGSSSVLQRKANKLQMNVKTSDLPGGQAFTTWWILFNNPEYCSDNSCGENDLPPFNENADPRIVTSVCFAAGHVIGNNGKANFAASRGLGDTDGCLFGPGALDSDKVEVHLVVRSHGPVVPENMPDQINSVGGGCVGLDLPAGTVPTEAGQCSDLQFAVHLP